MTFWAGFSSQASSLTQAIREETHERVLSFQECRNCTPGHCADLVVRAAEKQAGVSLKSIWVIYKDCCLCERAVERLAKPLSG